MGNWGCPVTFSDECHCGNQIRRPVPSLKDVELDEKQFLRIRCGSCGAIVRTSNIEHSQQKQQVIADG